jgi:flagellar basal body-associated protein FliL
MEPQNVPTPANPTPNQPTGQTKGSGSKVLIIIIIVFVVLIALGAVSFFLVRSYLNKKANQAITSITNSATTENSNQDNYQNAKSVSPTSDAAKLFDTDFQAVYTPILSAVKLTASTSDTTSETMTYVSKNKITSAQAQQIGTQLESKGYVKTSTDANQQGQYNYEFTKSQAGKNYNVAITINLENTPYDFDQQTITINITPIE